MTATYTFTASTVAESAKVNTNFAELGRLGSAIATASQGSITTAVDLTNLSVAVTISSAFAGASRRIKISALAPFSSTAASDTVRLFINEGATVLQQADILMSPTTGRTTTGVAFVEITPTSGSHTYKLQASRVAGSGTVTMNALTTAPATILVEAI